MNKIDSQIKKIKEAQKLGLMAHLVVGYPSLEATKQLVKVLAHAGADFVELQIPFSDPLADGPTIMEACDWALSKGVRVADAFEIMAELTKEVQIPLLFMSYYNIIFHLGVDKFAQKAAQAGASGLIVPDIPLEEEDEEHFIASARKNNLYEIHLASPVSTVERLKLNAQIAKGFVYCSARQGITGALKGLDPKIASYLKQVRECFNIPLAVGFGISNRDRVNSIRPFADIAIVGSAIIDIIKTSPKEKLAKNVSQFIRSLEI